MAKQTRKTTRRTARSKMDLAVPVSERVQIKEILLAESMTKRGAIRERLPKKLTMTVTAKTEADKVEKIVTVRLRFVLSAGYDDAEAGLGPEEAVRIEAGFVARYRVPSFKGLRKANIDAFGEMNGIFNVWPFWREFVQSTTARMGLPPLTLPVYRPADGAEETRESPKPAKRGTGTRKKARVPTASSR